MVGSLVEAALLGPPSTLPTNGVVAIRHDSSDSYRPRPLIGIRVRLLRRDDARQVGSTEAARFPTGPSHYLSARLSERVTATKSVSPLALLVWWPSGGVGRLRICGSRVGARTLPTLARAPFRERS